MDLDRLEQLALGATAGPWRACGDMRGGCRCGMVWAEGIDAPIATVTMADWGDAWPAIRALPDGKAEAFTETMIYGHAPEPVAKANAAFIAASNPTAILELVRAIRDLLPAIENLPPITE